MSTPTKFMNHKWKGDAEAHKMQPVIWTHGNSRNCGGGLLFLLVQHLSPTIKCSLSLSLSLLEIYQIERERERERHRERLIDEIQWGWVACRLLSSLIAKVSIACISLCQTHDNCIVRMGHFDTFSLSLHKKYQENKCLIY